MEHYQAKGVIIMIMFVMLSFALGMNGLTDTLLVIIVILLGNILSVLCKILNRLKK
ncbi:hypothetical protein [Bacteroides sp.]|uniref:hypothetical protein n=1 Tax=Bacteroides sp. TaxID=29523 RepID=UPI00258CD16F|nr:hypothetical protein [Bacteroides sp.]